MQVLALSKGARRAALVFLYPLLCAADQVQADDICRANPSSEVCVRTRTEQVRAAYDLPPLETHLIARDRVRQVFHAGPDLPAISFVAHREGGVVVTVHFPHGRGGLPAPSLRTDVPAAVWREVLALSEPFDAPAAAKRDWICLDGAAYLAEFVDADASISTSRAVRRAVGHDCEPGSVPAYVDAVARLALPLFPFCARIDTRQYGTALYRLAACRLLKGDRMTAADVLNRVRGFRTTSNEGDTAQLAGLFSARPDLHWDGAHSEGDPATLWALRAAPTIGVTQFGVEAIEGFGADQARLTGHLTRTADGPHGANTGMEIAQVEQLWRREPDGLFRVARATIGPWVPFSP